ncbi:MAG TPA: hypothetical protein VN238_22260, partial [Solirubrobacteraceae bacterium]|nr:hypothetical protein [Solirubrobacteraceae bacterium]
MSLLRRRPLLLAVPLLLVVAVGAWLLLGGEGDPYDPVRELDAVDSVDDWFDGDGTTVRLRDGSGTEDVLTVIGALPDDGRGALLRLGAASLDLREDRRGARQAAPALVEAARLNTRIDIDLGSGQGELEAWVTRSAEAVPVAKAIAASKLGPDQGVGTFAVKVERPTNRYGETAVGLDLPASTGLVGAALTAAGELAERGVTVASAGDRLELRVRAEDQAEAGPAFREASAALDALGPAERKEVDLVVDTPDERGGPWSTVEVLRGAPGSSPDRAVALLARLGTTQAFARTDLAHVRAELQGPFGTLAAAQAARAAGARRVE